MQLRTQLSACLAIAFSASLASAQSFNVKCGVGSLSPTYGAATGQSGPWNVVHDGTNALMDTNGNATPVTLVKIGCIEGTCATCSLGCGSLVPGTDDAALLGSWFDGACHLDNSITSVWNLAPGRYRMTTYAYHACQPAQVSGFYVQVWSGLHGATHTSTFQVGGVAWSGSWSGFPYHDEVFTVFPGQYVHIEHGTLGSFTNRGGFTGFQLQKLDSIETSCAGDGTSISCPCGNSGAAGHGCANSIFAAGGRIDASGVASVATDTIVLRGTSLPNSTCTFFQGTSLAPTPVFDGILCASGQLIRLGTKAIAGNETTYPGVGDPLVSVRGQIPALGGTYHYTLRYRNAATFCTPDTANFTNAIAIAWAP